jgi:threonine aldolase
MIDLRRDTTTRPDDRMRTRAFQAVLGDSVYGEDLAQNELEELAASVLGKEAAIFLPSGTMGNLVAMLVHAGRGGEVILEENAHIRTSETGGAAAVAGLMLRTVPGPEGVPTPEEIEAVIRAEDVHYPRTSLICLETTHYRYGGIVPSLEAMEAVRSLADRRGIPVHLDGARIWNAAVALSVTPAVVAEHAHSVMASLSKGLGAPVGSVLAGEADFIAEARRYRKMLGGGMRQTGWLCTCGIEALRSTGMEQLQRDHRNARILAEGLARRLADLPDVGLELAGVQTNFVLLRVGARYGNACEIVERLARGGVLATAAGTGVVRFVTCSAVDEDGVTAAVDVVRAVLEG